MRLFQNGPFLDVNRIVDRLFAGFLRVVSHGVVLDVPRTVTTEKGSPTGGSDLILDLLSGLELSPP